MAGRQRVWVAATQTATALAVVHENAALATASLPTAAVTTSAPQSTMAATATGTFAPLQTPTPMPSATPVPPTSTTVPTVTPTQRPGLHLTLAPGVDLELVHVPAGKFTMGSADGDDDEKPQHTVYLDEYYIGKYEVTVAQFRAFVQATGYKTAAEQRASSYVYTWNSWDWVRGADWQHPRGPGSDLGGRDSYPVMHVTWDDAVAFCKWASGKAGRTVRLPTEAEWEKAARGSDGRRYPWGNDEPGVGRGNYDMHVGDATQVGTYSPLDDSIYGCADMTGNVWEWTSTLYEPYPYDANDGREDQESREQRVLRGGAFHLSTGRVRAALRCIADPGGRHDSFGFRVVVPPGDSGLCCSDLWVSDSAGGVGPGHAMRV